MVACQTDYLVRSRFGFKFEFWNLDNGFQKQIGSAVFQRRDAPRTSLRDDMWYRRVRGVGSAIVVRGGTLGTLSLTTYFVS
jgi:hypothetical protein